MTQDTDIKKHLPPIGVLEFDEDGPGVPVSSTNSGPFVPLSAGYVERDTEQPRTRLDYEDLGDPDVASCGFIVSASLVFDGDGLENEYEVKFSFGGETVSRDESEVAGFQREYEGALIARALRVATAEELDAAGLDRRPRATCSPPIDVDDDPEMAALVKRACDEQRAEMRHDIAASLTDEELAEAGLVRRSTLLEQMRRMRQRYKARSNAEALGMSPTFAGVWAGLHRRAMQAVEMYIEARSKALRWRSENPAGRNPEMPAAERKGNALMRVLEEMAERRAEQESGGAS